MNSDLMSEIKKIEDIALGEGFAYEDNADVVLSLAGGLSDLEVDQAYGFDTGSAKSPSGTTYGLRIQNTHAANDLVIKLFGYEGFKYTNANIVITAQSGYGVYEMFAYSNWFNPAEIVSLRITSTSTQIDQMSLKWVRSSVYGKQDSDILSLASFRTESDYQTGVITVPFRFLLCYDAYIETTILHATTVDVLLFSGVRRDLAKSVEAAKSSPQLMSKSGRKSVLGAGGGAK